jgi:hypothetical protein
VPKGSFVVSEGETGEVRRGENHGKSMGKTLEKWEKPWKLHGKSHGNPWEKPWNIMMKNYIWLVTGTMEWIMTFQKQLGIVTPTDELHHFSEGFNGETMFEYV